MGNEGDIKLHPQWLDVLGVEFEKKTICAHCDHFCCSESSNRLLFIPPDHNGLVRSTPHRLIKYVW